MTVREAIDVLWEIRETYAYNSNKVSTQKLKAIDMAVDALNESMTPAPLVYGWICPKCGRSVSPCVSVCPCSYEPIYEVTC